LVKKEYKTHPKQKLKTASRKAHTKRIPKSTNVMLIQSIRIKKAIKAIKDAPILAANILGPALVIWGAMLKNDKIFLPQKPNGLSLGSILLRIKSTHPAIATIHEWVIKIDRAIKITKSACNLPLFSSSVCKLKGHVFIGLLKILSLISYEVYHFTLKG
jgi:hypothetical protein